ncbi:MAG: GAF domain-containing protein [Candidatus Aureabacteria bacterium]|jgi:hypothetical protein|nr:GAF domain-containing protein [Candidatus Auribacterota bacterium]NLW94560.1 GAF domain-containing protein [Chlamydiota bacterium]HQM51701.1 GAF domain-containing protein [bacterium]
MDIMNANPFDPKTLTEDVLKEWQNMLNDTAKIIGVPAGLITRVDDKEIEIILSSETDGNPYPAAFRSHYPDSGWYCEHTLKSKGLNLIPNALQDSRWKDNAAAVDLHMLSYLGMPINLPDGKQFGTVCFIDNKQNAHNDLHIRLVEQIKRMIELSLCIILAQGEIDRRDRLLDDLSKIYPICSYCKKIREETGKWVPVEQYINSLSGAMPSHGICPDCYKREMDNLA